MSGSSTSSKIFHTFPKSIKRPPFSGPVIRKRYSKLKAILKLASLNSLMLRLLPGPSLYAFHALLSFAPPEKYDLEKGILVEFPKGIAIPAKPWRANTRSLPKGQCLM